MKKKWLVCTFLLTGLWLGGSAWAEGKFAKIDVYFDKINLAINGQNMELSKDSIIYNGSIYIPLRNLSDMLGAEVSWNDETRSVNLDFIQDKQNTLFNASQKGLYQYIALQNNLIMADMLKCLQKSDIDGLKAIAPRYDELRTLADGLKNPEMALIIDKMKAAVELIRTGLDSKSMDDYYIAWNIFDTSAKRLNAILNAQTSAN